MRTAYTDPRHRRNRQILHPVSIHLSPSHPCSPEALESPECLESPGSLDPAVDRLAADLLHRSAGVPRPGIAGARRLAAGAGSVALALAFALVPAAMTSILLVAAGAFAVAVVALSVVVAVGPFGVERHSDRPRPISPRPRPASVEQPALTSFSARPALSARTATP